MKRPCQLAMMLLAAAMAAGCDRPVATPEAPSGTPDSGAAAAPAAAMDDAMARQLPEAELVFVGEVVSLSPSPHMWSGLAEMTQSVTYRVTRVLRGAGVEAGARIEVRHLLVEGAPTVDSATAELLPSLFHPGASLLVLARPQRDGWRCVSERASVAVATPALVDAVSRDLASQP
jgi:hypothetical protein